jgi:hypothetical protein
MYSEIARYGQKKAVFLRRLLRLTLGIPSQADELRTLLNGHHVR